MTLAGTLELIAQCRLRRPVVRLQLPQPHPPLRPRPLPPGCRRAGGRGAPAHRPARGRRPGGGGRRDGEPARSHPPGRPHHASRAAPGRGRGRRGFRLPRRATRRDRCEPEPWPRISPIRSAGCARRPDFRSRWGSASRARSRPPRSAGWPTAWWWAAHWSTRSARAAWRPHAGSWGAAGGARPGPGGGVSMDVGMLLDRYARAAGRGRHGRHRWPRSRWIPAWLDQPVAVLLLTGMIFTLRAAPIRLSKYSYLTQTGIPVLVGAVTVGPTPGRARALPRRAGVRRRRGSGSCRGPASSTRAARCSASSPPTGPTPRCTTTAVARRSRSISCPPPRSWSVSISSPPGRCSTSPCCCGTSWSTPRRS